MDPEVSVLLLAVLVQAPTGERCPVVGHVVADKHLEAGVGKILPVAIAAR